jgi:hypothetical protein
MVGRVLSCEKKTRPAFLKKPWFSRQKTGFSRVGGIGNKVHICRTHYKRLQKDQINNPAKWSV